MPVSKIIGRNGQQCFTIDNLFVSNHHVRIDYDEYHDCYTVTDLNATNGTYIMEERNGMDKLRYEKVTCVTVPPGTWLALGGTKPGQSIHFLVNQVKRNHEDFSREFGILERRYNEYLDLLQNIQAKQKKQNLVHRLIQGAISLAIVGLLYLLLPQDLKVGAVIVASCMSAVLMGVLNLNGKLAQRLKTTKANAKEFFLCPKCGDPLTETSINSRQCRHCHAH